MRKYLAAVIVFFLCLQTLKVKAWDVDFSRRQKKLTPVSSFDQPNQEAAAPVSEPLREQSMKVPGFDIVPASQSQNQNQNQWQNQNGPRNAIQSEIPNFGSKDSTTTVPSRLEGIVKRVVTPGSGSSDRQEFVILNTAHGFIPSNVRLHKGLHYTVHVVNVNDEKKNVSFMLDAFGEHHATYFGKIKSFDLDPDKEGIFEFQCPETSAQGKFVIFGNQLKIERRVSSSP